MRHKYSLNVEFLQIFENIKFPVSVIKINNKMEIKITTEVVGIKHFESKY